MRTQVEGAQLLSLEEVSEILARPKSLVSDMAWAGQRGKPGLGWVSARMAVQFDDEAALREQFFVECQWRKAAGRIPEHWGFNLLYGGNRIYAIHVQPTSKHENWKAGKGRPMFGLEIDGIHEHTWSKDGDGYAEAIDLPVDRPDIVWKKFLKRANINEADFFHPDHNQPELKL